MKVFYLIGNGFDLNLGMKTSYGDFYDFYKTINSGNFNVKRLKQEISGNLKNWSDLELALGNYTEKQKSAKEFDDAFADIGENLAKYLQQVENNFDFSKLSIEKLCEFLVFPERFLLPADKDKVYTLKMNHNGSQFETFIMSFNYTRSIENILKEINNQRKIGTFHNSNVILDRIEHIHGFTDNRLVMGVNDLSQIKNTLFQTDQNVVEALVKSECNRVYKHNVDALCKNKISSADLICVFGSSIGDTDNLWWNLIGEQLKRNCNIIIYNKGEIISPVVGYRIGRLERNVKDHFLSKTSLTDDEKIKASSNIYVGYNTDMFKLNK